ncbi:DUF1659 domain-containing protein [Peptostreptococcus faecalis]|uniref:DUF1659 domain-containing protein n=1 Tax=Peptostreptococcus faecalis TaxID=2045015 RepID=UPI000C7C601F|nr:DUF1659 domain-containing protein [Peptostreptococcus faecalis]
MAELKNKKVTLRIKLSNGQDERGNAKYKNLNLNDINPKLSDEDFYTIAEKVAGLQKLKVVGIYKIQNDRVVNV